MHISWDILYGHWNGNVVILMKFSWLAVLEVVKTTTSSAASHENFIKWHHFRFSVVQAHKTALSKFWVWKVGRSFATWDVWLYLVTAVHTGHSQAWNMIPMHMDIHAIIWYNIWQHDPSQLYIQLTLNKCIWKLIWNIRFWFFFTNFIK